MRDQEKVIQQFQERCLQDMIILLPMGSDDEVEKKVQQYLKVYKDRFGLELEQKDIVDTGFKWAVEVKWAEEKSQAATAGESNTNTRGAACAGDCANRSKRWSKQHGGNKCTARRTKMKKERKRTSMMCEFGKCCARTHAHEEHWKCQEQERKNMMDEFMERSTDHVTGKGSVRMCRVQGREQ